MSESTVILEQSMCLNPTRTGQVELTQRIVGTEYCECLFGTSRNRREIKAIENMAHSNNKPISEFSGARKLPGQWD